VNVAVIIFPGSNCDKDCLDVCGRVMGWRTRPCWYGEPLTGEFDLIVLPGGFSYGDYLRAGALAALAPVMQDVRRQAARGAAVLGICNGFQILCEAGLLPGALRVNRDLTFHCEDVWLRVERRDTLFTRAVPAGRAALRVPIAHREGNYYASPGILARLEGEGRVLFRYATPEGEAAPGANPNGALNSIAGILNDRGNVLGMMPHPERVSEEILGGLDGRLIFESIALSLNQG